MITQIHPFHVEEVYHDLGLPIGIEEEIDKSKYEGDTFPENPYHMPSLWIDNPVDTHIGWFTEVRFLKYFINRYMNPKSN